ncbi:MAG: ribonuclease P protein component [Patescibacteria group bacterium]|nr:ribonuclease P protein component [Patescibacteria group bacterium]
MKKAQIIRKTKDFKFIFKNGQREKNSDLTIIYLFNPENKNNRFAFLISKKISKKACKRNLLKRRLKAICDQIDFKKSGYDIVFIPRPSLLAKNFSELKDLTERLMQKANLI